MVTGKIAEKQDKVEKKVFFLHSCLRICIFYCTFAAKM